MDVRRLFFASAGFAALTLGAIAAIVPLIPTTPFVLIAAGCFAKSSPRLERWLACHNTFGPILLAWRIERAMPVWAKPRALVMVVVGFCFSIVICPVVPVKILLVPTGIWVFRRVYRVPVIDEIQLQAAMDTIQAK
ncbi:MAG: DUF454 family protein [Rhodobacterales bacterium]|nr:DUF454 family protein [Rhodobacterales bacterium]